MNLYKSLKHLAAFTALLSVLNICQGGSLGGAILKPSEASCKVYVAYREASGESAETIRAVLDVVGNRSRGNNETICKTIFKKGQFPWAVRGVKKVTEKKFLQKFQIAVNMPPQLDSRYLYFNHVRHKFGRNTKRVGHLYFSTI